MRTLSRFGPLLLSLFALACNPVQNVRAYRAFAHEDANIKVVIDRAEDIARSLELIDRILSGTTYTPNDLWARRLPLSDAEARVIKADLKERYPYNQGEFEVPIVKVYKTHIERVLSEYAPPPEKAMYPSLIEAVASLGPRPEVMKDSYKLHRAATANLGDALEEEARLKDEVAALGREGERRAREPEFAAVRLKVQRASEEVDKTRSALEQEAELLATDASLTAGQKGQIARDAFGALSVALRLELEALALMPVVAISAVRSLPNAPKDLTFKPHLKILRQAYHLPMYLSGLEGRVSRQLAALELMAKVLGRALKTSLGDSPGFALRESIVDQVVGMTLDSFRVDARAGADAFIFSSIGTGATQGSSDGKNTSDYRGRNFKLDYRIKPIVLANARLDVSLDWIHMPGVFNLGFGYSTDRAFQSGGKVENTSLVRELGIDGPASDILDAALGLLGVRSSVRVATWNAGELRQVRATNVDEVVSRAPLQLSQTQVDVGYDVLWAMNDPKLKSFAEELVIGGRYLRYTLPRIVYELRDTSVVSGETHYSFVDPQTGAYVGRESPPQPVTSEYFMFGASVRFGQGEAPRWSPYLDLGFFGGGGPTKYYFLQNPAGGNVEANRVHESEASFMGNGQGALGLRWRLLPRGSRLRLDLRAHYQANFIYSKITRTGTVEGRAVSTDFGAVDVFHGPAVFVRGSL